jgi:hypothetical protein
MSLVAIIGAVLAVAFVNVLTGMLPVAITGDLQLAVWIGSLLVGVATFVAIRGAMR